MTLVTSPIRYALRNWMYFGVLICLMLRADCAPPTVEELMRLPFVERVNLSPDGNSVAALAVENNRRVLMVYDIASRKTDFVTNIPAMGNSSASSYDIYSFDWLDDRQLLFNVSFQKAYALGMYLVKIDRLNKSRPINFYDATRIMPSPEKRPNRAIIWITQSADNRGNDAGLIEVDSTRAAGVNVEKRFLPIEGFETLGWHFTHDGEVALTTVINDAGLSLHRLQPDGKTWKKVPYDFAKARILKLDPDGHRLWSVVHEVGQGFELKAYDLDTGLFGEAVHRDKNYDYSKMNMFFSRANGALLGFRYQGSRWRSIWLDPALAALQAKVDHANPLTDNIMLGFDDHQKRYVFNATSSISPSEYLLADVEADSLSVIASSAPWLKDKDMQPTQSFGFTTRDGAKREAYLTLPAGASKKNPVPLVILLTPGLDRAGGYFNATVQYLAGLGYGVVQPNYRGVSGYAENANRTLKFDTMQMQSDVADATAAAIRIGCFDSSRVALVGGDFTGYLAMATAGKNPEIYRCVAAYRGVLDWKSFTKKLKETDPAMAAVFQPSMVSGELDVPIGELKTPVLLVYPTEDSALFSLQSDRFISMLKRQGSNLSRVELKDETGNLTAAGSIKYHKALGAFLSTHLGAPATP